MLPAALNGDIFAETFLVHVIQTPPDRFYHDVTFLGLTRFNALY